MQCYFYNFKLYVILICSLQTTEIWVSSMVIKTCEVINVEILIRPITFFSTRLPWFDTWTSQLRLISIIRLIKIFPIVVISHIVRYQLDFIVPCNYLYLCVLSEMWTQCLIHADKSFRNLIKLNRNQIIFTMFRLIWNQTDVCLLPN